MTRIFLSYTGADSVITRRVARALEAMDGVSVFLFEDPERAGARFIQEIPGEIEKADIFLALMSPASRDKPYCGMERDLAVHRQARLDHQFIYVFEVADTEFAGTGFLAAQGWVDLKQPVDDDKLARALRALPLDGRRGRAVSPVDSEFRNRTDELNKVTDALTTMGGEDLWIVVSPPKMGKSWFLEKVRSRFVDAVPTNHVTHVDLREQPMEFRANWVKVLCALLGVRVPASGGIGREERREITAEVLRRSCHQLAILDSAELLEPEVCARLRTALTTIYATVQDSGYEGARLSVVVGSRRHEDWQGYDTDGGVPTLFHALLLTNFGVAVIRRALLEVQPKLSVERRNRWADGLHALSEGLPAVLAEALRWAEGRAFLDPEDCGGQAVFDVVAGPYVRKDLLTFGSLLPFVAERLLERMAAIERTLKAMVTYRMLTMSHLKHHIDADPAFGQVLVAAGWSQADLWEALRRTALLDDSGRELWHVFNAPIRHLLYRYYYPTDEMRVDSHVRARRFYEKWAVHGAGTEQVVVLVECLWHEATSLCCTGAPDVVSRLPEIAGELTGEFMGTQAYEPAEVYRSVRQRLQGDEEFVRLLRPHNGLFDNVLDKIRGTISGGG